MTTKYRTIHKDFRFNGSSYSKEELKAIAYDLIKEGQNFERPIGDFLTEWLDDKSYVEVHTSGSTGNPKQIQLQKRHMVNSAEATGTFFGLQPGDSCLLCLSAGFIAGKMMLVRAMVLGLHLDFVAPSSNPIGGNSKKYDFTAMVPLQFENSIDELHKIKTLIVGGAPLSQSLQEQVQKHAQTTQVFETYGMTETITHVAVKKIFPFGSKKQNFKTLPGVKIAIDHRKCLVIEAPKICDESITTNDVVNLVAENEFEWLGRYDNVINSGGVKLFPEQIEAKLYSVIESRFFVASIPDEKLGQKLILIVEGEIDLNKLSKKLDSLSSLEKYEVPQSIYQLAAFRETDTGKVKRKETLNLLKS